MYVCWVGAQETPHRQNNPWEGNLNTMCSTLKPSPLPTPPQSITNTPSARSSCYISYFDLLRPHGGPGQHLGAAPELPSPTVSNLPPILWVFLSHLFHPLSPFRAHCLGTSHHLLPGLLMGGGSPTFRLIPAHTLLPEPSALNTQLLCHLEPFTGSLLPLE